MIIENSLFTEDIPKMGVIDGHIMFSLHSITPEDIAVSGICGNLAASLLFEKLQAQGTNVIFALKKSRGTLDVVARNENDGLNISWEPKTLDGNKLKQIQEQLQDKMLSLEQPAEGGGVSTEKKDDEEDVVEDEFLTKQLLRIP